MVTFPNAKINLGLDITAKRADGYHEISTLFYPIPLCDTLEMVEGNRTSINTYGNDIECDVKDNLVIKAYNVMRSHYGIPPMDFHLVKKIPSGAGLGGGSADAAFAMKMLRDEYLPHISIEAIAALAAKIGADCPFFLYNTPMFATGIGEIFTPAPKVLAGYFLVLVKPEVYVSTREAYSMVKPATPQKSIKEIVCGDIAAWKYELKNDFEEGIFALHPQLAEIKQALYSYGAIYASMSGSGSSIYGIFDNVNLAESVYANLQYKDKYMLAL